MPDSSQLDHNHGPSGSDTYALNSAGPSRQQTYDNGGYNPHQPHSQSYGAGNNAIPSVNPTQRQLDELLASLQQNNNPARETGRPQGGGGRRDLISPFGPLQRQKSGSFDHTSLAPVTSDIEADRRPHEERRQSGERSGEGWDTMSFTRALPIISKLLEEEAFKMELKKVSLPSATISSATVPPHRV